MFMDYELNVKMNEVIAGLYEEYKDEYNGKLDMYSMQCQDESTPYETVIVHLGDSRGLKQSQYLFNAMEERPDEMCEFRNKTCDYYREHTDTTVYVVVVDVFPRTIKVYEVGYTTVAFNTQEAEYVLNTKQRISLGKSKFANKIIRKE